MVALTPLHISSSLRSNVMSEPFHIYISFPSLFTLPTNHFDKIRISYFGCAKEDIKRVRLRVEGFQFPSMLTQIPGRTSRPALSALTQSPLLHSGLPRLREDLRKSFGGCEHVHQDTEPNTKKAHCVLKNTQTTKQTEPKP